MMALGSKEWLQSEVQGSGGWKFFNCPKCTAVRGHYCDRRGNAGPSFVHKERLALWREYQHTAPDRLAWLQRMVLPYLTFVIEDYLVKGKRSKSKRKDIEIAWRRVEEMRTVLEMSP